MQHFFTDSMRRLVFSQKFSNIGDIKRFFRHIGYTWKNEKNDSLFQFQYSQLASYNKL